VPRVDCTALQDFLTRAMRIEERPLLTEALARAQVEERERMQEQYAKLAEQAKQAHALALKVREGVMMLI